MNKRAKVSAESLNVGTRVDSRKGSKASAKAADFPSTVFESGRFSPSTNITFNPNARELKVGWHSAAELILCINAYPNGVTLSMHQNEPLSVAEGDKVVEGNATFDADQFHLRVKDTRDYRIPAGKYFLHKQNYLEALEQHLSSLHRSGKLSKSVIYLGTASDPFLSFHKRFNVTMGVLRLLEQYRPGFLVVQSRSPMVIAGLPMFKAFEDKMIVAMPIETNSERSVQRYTPGQPKISERLIAARGLRMQGVAVNLMASPILPYGEFFRDAWDFAELLDRYADYISVGCLATADGSAEAQLKELEIAQRLVADDKLMWLRPHAYKYLYYALSVIASDKLLLPVKVNNKPSQLSLFAA